MFDQFYFIFIVAQYVEANPYPNEHPHVLLTLCFFIYLNKKIKEYRKEHGCLHCQRYKTIRFLDLLPIFWAVANNT
jgi:hypothetical protein